jgi:hypothetical protein
MINHMPQAICEPDHSQSSAGYFRSSPCKRTSPGPVAISQSIRSGHRTLYSTV